MTVVREPVTNLNTLPEKAFRDLVDDDIRGKASREVSTTLRSPDIVGRWFETLKRMKVSIEGQLAAKEGDANAAIAEAELLGDVDTAREIQAGFEKWKAGAWRFKTGLDMAILDADQLARAAAAAGGDTKVEDVIAERNAALGQVGVLTREAEVRDMKLRQAQGRVATLERAILKHKESFAADYEPSDDDEELWALAEQSYFQSGLRDQAKF